MLLYLSSSYTKPENHLRKNRSQKRTEGMQIKAEEPN